MDLFDSQNLTDQGTPLTKEESPLAVRMRPQTIDEVVGQDHLLNSGSPLRRLISPRDRSKNASSVILWGPPGTGKTTLAYLVASSSGRRFVELSAVSSGVKEVRAVIKSARDVLRATGEQTVLFIDEVHRFSKSQQDALLPAVENRWVILVAATTENPAFSVVSPLLSRSLLLTLRPLSSTDVQNLLRRALRDPRGLGGSIEASDEVLEQLANLAGPDGRRSLTLLEAACARVLEDGRSQLSEDDIESAADAALVRYG